ncbi:MAG: HAMP domain-containing histidine kinase, partial [Oscillochloris sp.]|nr:HAMP domain-containing histidine kinase [Oscillochloris sp.]
LIDITSRVQAEAAVRELNASLDRQVVERTAALQQANADLSRALRLKDEFLSMMSHELRTPLSIILTQTESLLDDLYGPVEAPQRQALATIVQSGRHLLALLSDILDLARMTAGRIDLDRERINVALICEVVLQILAPTAQAKGIQLSHMLVPGTTEVYADERRLTQMLINLLDNALKFTPAGGSVALEVSTDPAHQQVHFSVWDNGIGIAPENQARIFAPFIQVDARLAREYTGTGLGLALVRQLVELHGGSISLVSALGQGSRFTVSLPCAPAP